MCERLSDDDDIDASEISVNVSGGVVKLTGSVEDRRMKYHVEEAVSRCSGVKDVDNQLRVQSRQFGESQRSMDSSSGQRGGSSGLSTGGNSSGSSRSGYGAETSVSSSTGRTASGTDNGGQEPRGTSGTSGTKKS